MVPPRQVHFIVERFAFDMAPGDTFLADGPFEGGTHAHRFRRGSPDIRRAAVDRFGLLAIEEAA